MRSEKGWYGEGIMGRGASTEPRGPGWVGEGLWGGEGACGERAGRRTPCAERAVMLPAVQSLRRAGSEAGVWGDKRRDAASTLRIAVLGAGRERARGLG